uniref:uncharacterized protein LOC131139500 isoform X2 n=1 Tax=Doryrhamphus excisus TaxID=161450 RepID=UPI0025ADF81D|nr:uncharacterized protein LOC131139500 isoform X2 [Doryrhamphus excisus]
MELPLGGPALRHYTQSRPRPHRQKLNYRPSRPQETIIESENEVLELIGRVDEGVEEFFTKKVLPAGTEKKQDEVPLHEESITVDEVVPATSIPCPPPTKTLRRKLGDFFTLRKRRGVKSEPSHEGRPKKASIADLIRPLREAARAEKEKDKDRVKEHDKENEKEKGKEQPSGITGELAVRETLASDAPPLRGEVAPPRRALREGKSQSLILLSGSAAGTANARKKQLEGQHSFEQKLHLMLQRIGVSKAQPEETQVCNPEREMKKAESEGTIIDSKAEPTPTFTKHRTMSASSDTRHQIRPSMSAHESAGKPPLLPKPVIKPTTSGRNTPENELVQIEEGDTSTPTKLKSPTAAPSGPATPAVTTNAAADSTNAPISLSSTVTSDSESPAVSANAATTDGTDEDGKPSEPEAQPVSTEPSPSSFPTTLTELSAPDPSTSTCLDSITSTFSTTSDSTTTVNILENINDHRSESLATSTDMSVKSERPESNGIVSVGDEAVPVVAAVATTIQLADVKSDAATTTSSSVDLASVSPTSPISSKSTSVAPSSTPPVSDTPIISSSALPPASTNSITTTTSTDYINSSSSSIVPHVSSSETNLTDSISTATSNAHITTTDAITSPLVTDPLSCKKTSSAFSSVITCLPASDDSSPTPPALTHDSPGQDLQTNIDERSSPTVKDIDVVIEVVQKSKQTESKIVMDDAEECEPCTEKATQDNSEVTKREVQEASVKAEDITVATEVMATEPTLEKERLNQEDTKSADGK